MGKPMKSSLERFIASHPGSGELTERALKVSRGLHTDAIFTLPPYVYVTHAKGSHKWDVDGNEYIDYVMGFGALLLGHAHPAMVAAVKEQIEKEGYKQNLLNLGVEFAYDEMFMLRAGSRQLFMNNVEGGLTFGAGIKYDISDGFGISINYAYANYGRLLDVHFFDVSLEL